MQNNAEKISRAADMIAIIEKGLTPNDAKTPGQDPLMAGGKDPNPIENQQYAFSHFGDLIDVRIGVCPFWIRLGNVTLIALCGARKRGRFYFAICLRAPEVDAVSILALLLNLRLWVQDGTKGGRKTSHARFYPKGVGRFSETLCQCGTNPCIRSLGT